MQVKALGIFLGVQRIGVLFQYGSDPSLLVTRFVADDIFAEQRDGPAVSLSMRADDSEAQRLLWASITAPVFNGRYSARNEALLPPFFQGLLPEGVFRDRLAQLRGCDPMDYFEMLAACGRDLPGNVYARPVELNWQELSQLLPQNAEPIELSEVAEPMIDGVSISGVQPKVGVIKEGDRYVGRTKMRDAHIIAKLPVVGFPKLPELEYLSLRLAQLAGVSVCNVELAPLHKLAVEHGYDLGDADQQTNFLAVTRFDRAPGRRIHVEDFSQILGIAPEDKYTSSYLEIAAVLMSEPSLGEPAVLELLRRMVVNELLGNSDMHLKNIGVIYCDGKAPTLSPAYDIVGYSAYHRREGHALHLMPLGYQEKPRLRAESAETPKRAKPRLSPLLVREFCSALGMPEKPAASVIQKTVLQALKRWPEQIRMDQLTFRQKDNLLQHLGAHPMVVSMVKRDPRLAIIR